VAECLIIMMIAFLFAGFVLLYFGADWLVKGSARIALRHGISSLVVGLTVVAFGTSAPELVVSVKAGLSGLGDISLGNVIGSNIFNILLVLGITSIITPLIVPVSIFYDIIILMIITFLLFAFMFIGRKHELEKWQGYLFLIFYVLYIAFLVIRG